MERAVLLGFELKSSSPVSRVEESVEELAELAASAGAQVAGTLIQVRQARNAATLIGRGKVEELKALASSVSADVVLVDFDLTPTQQRNLEKELDRKVIDRTQLILDIFASRPHPRRPPTGGTRAVAISPAQVERSRRGHVPPGRRHRHARSR